MLQSQMASPIGGVRVVVNDDGAVVSVAFVDDGSKCAAACPEAAPVVRQLEAYFAGELRAFELELSPEGSEFERRVWDELVRIPFGLTDTYGAVATRLGDPAAGRAVGLANARNPIAIIVPCHRVIGADGDLTGYAGGLWRKRWLLAHESGQKTLDFSGPTAFERSNV